MHSYLRAIGFSNIKTKSQANILIDNAINNPTTRISTTISTNTSLVQISKDFGEGIGISIIGEYDDRDTLHIEHYFPYLIGENVTQEEEIHIEKHSNNESYSGICEDLNIGMSLIFYLYNIADFVRTKWLNQYAKEPTMVKLSALSIKGNVLFDVLEPPTISQTSKNTTNSRTNLIAAARAGDIDALESLTLDDMDTYTIISRRAKKEDILTIVKSYFMPCGIETELYSVMGTILNIKKISNTITNELVYNLTVDCNNIVLDICINSADLLGEPSLGRRFKGTIWLQGLVEL